MRMTVMHSEINKKTRRPGISGTSEQAAELPQVAELPQEYPELPENLAELKKQVITVLTSKTTAYYHIRSLATC